MTYDVSDGQGAQALDANQLRAISEGDVVVSGCAPSAGSAGLETDIASGTIHLNGSEVSVSAQTVTHSAGSSHPRKDLVTVDSTGTANIAKGTAEAKAPSSASRFDTYDPSPPDGTGVTGVVIATVWVEANQSGTFEAADIRDRRVLKSDLQMRVASAGTDELSVTNETFIRLTRSTASSSTTAGTFSNVFDGESKDVRGEASNGQFTPDQDGDYEVMVMPEFEGTSSEGNTGSWRLRNVTDGTTVGPVSIRFDTQQDRPQGPLSWVFNLTAGKTYEIQARDEDASYNFGTRSLGLIRWSVVA